MSKQQIGQCYSNISQAFALTERIAAKGPESLSGGVVPTDAVDLINRYYKYLTPDPPTTRRVRDVVGQVTNEGLLDG